ncbi:hypothetical protein ID144_13915 [Pseudomonas sp. JM0905a]|uniref:hypothetical protein n=1 Tax=Pseudomonas sp. JM0905a TaxID=2772484 RepID=UPI00168266AB|nr:hypothetical protein [Pseudomonas sp. JM0905a]MBD2838142.1 hypothetical protein [Pseudomonas sp. JM0905a]
MSTASKTEFHFVHLNGEITGDGKNPAISGDHHCLSINRSSISKLIATRESSNIGDPLPSTRPPLPDETTTAATSFSPIDSRALGVDFSLTSPAVVEAAPELPAPTEDSIAEEVERESVDVEDVSEASAEARPEPVVPEPESEPAAAAEPEPETEVGSPQEIEDLPSDYAEIATASTPPQQATENLNEPATVETEHPTTMIQPQPTLPTVSNSEADSVLFDVQSTLDSLADMAKGLTQQKLETVKQQEGLEQRKALLQEKERILADKDEQLRLLEARLTREVSNLERNAEDNARALAERSTALKALAESVEARDRNTAKLAETLRLEKQRNDELAESLVRRAESLDEREAALNRKDDELAEKLKQLIAAKDRFRALVKAFNETVQFNNTLNAISSTALDDGQH